MGIKNKFRAKLFRTASWVTLASTCVPSHLVLAATVTNDTVSAPVVMNNTTMYQAMLADPQFSATVSVAAANAAYNKDWNDFKADCGDPASVSTTKNCDGANIKCNMVEWYHFYTSKVNSIKDNLQAKKDELAAKQLTDSKKDAKPLELVQQKDVEAYCGKVPSLKTSSKSSIGVGDSKSIGISGANGLQYAQNSRDGNTSFRGLRTRHIMKNITFNYPYDANMWGPTIRSTMTVSNLGETEIGAFSSAQLSSISWFNGQFCMYVPVPTERKANACDMRANRYADDTANPHKAKYQSWISKNNTAKSAYYTAWMNLNTQLNGMFSNFKMSWIRSPQEAKLFRFSSKDANSMGVDSVAATEGPVMKAGKMEKLPGGHAVRYTSVVPYTIFPVFPADTGNILGIYTGQSVGGFKLPSITTLVALSAHVQVCDTEQGGLGIAQVDGDIDFVAGTKFVHNAVEAAQVMAENTQNAAVSCPIYAMQEYLQENFSEQLNSMLQATQTGPELKMAPQKAFFSVGPF